MKAVISVLQMDLYTGDVEFNLNRAEALMEKAARLHPHFMVLPEMWATGFAFDRLKSLAAAKTSLILNFLSKKAKQYQTHIIGGSLPEEKEGKLFNTSFVFNPAGETLGKQSKIHPFPLTGEDQYFSAGDTTFPLETIFGKIGIVICYDLRFPEISAALAQKGARILLVPAQWPNVREEHWKILLRARAIENQVFVVGANRTGGRSIPHCGRSMIINPWGEVIAELREREAVLTEEINLAQIEEVRSRFPLPSRKNEK